MVYIPELIATNSLIKTIGITSLEFLQHTATQIKKNTLLP